MKPVPVGKRPRNVVAGACFAPPEAEAALAATIATTQGSDSDSHRAAAAQASAAAGTSSGSAAARQAQAGILAARPQRAVWLASAATGQVVSTLRYKPRGRAAGWLAEDGTVLEGAGGASGAEEVKHELGLVECITLAKPLRDVDSRAWTGVEDGSSDSDSDSDSGSDSGSGSDSSSSDGDTVSSEEFGDPDEVPTGGGIMDDASSACESLLFAHSSTAIHLLDPRPSRVEAAGVLQWHADLGVIRDVALTPSPALAFCVQAGAHHGPQAVQEAAGALGGGVAFVLHGEPRAPPRVSRVAQLPWQQVHHRCLALAEGGLLLPSYFPPWATPRLLSRAMSSRKSGLAATETSGGS